MNGAGGSTLQNVLSVSTAANNRYLLHFNSLNSLTQWTGAVRLAMYEQACLQEAYTGSILAGKARYLNNVKSIMEISRFKNEDWARVRFGAGTPWQRCWSVISPPDEKEIQKAQREHKKQPYGSKAILPKGDIKFYDTKKITKKTKPIATITDAYAAYAVYPQSYPLIDQSSLVKLEGLITIYSVPEATTEGMVYIMPETHVGVSGFEMMLRFLFPVWDTFRLYGRPQKLITGTLDQNGLMFAMPNDTRFEYAASWDVSGLIHTEGSQTWGERQWRKELKKLSASLLSTPATAGDTGEMGSPPKDRKSRRISLFGTDRKAGIRFDDRPISSSKNASPARASMENISLASKDTSKTIHRRSASEVYDRPLQNSTSIQDEAPSTPIHGGKPTRIAMPTIQSYVGTPIEAEHDQQIAGGMPPVTPVANPPAFLHAPSQKPATRPIAPPELVRAESRIDAATLQEMHEATSVREAPRKEDLVPDEVAIPLSQSSPSRSTDSFDKGLRNNELDTVDIKSTTPEPSPTKRKPIPVSPANQINRRPVGSPNLAPNRDTQSYDYLEDHIQFYDSNEAMPHAGEKASVLANDNQTFERSLPQDMNKPRDLREKPRLGQLKTVGDINHGPTSASPADAYYGRFKSQSRPPQDNNNVPTIDFGPTYSYKPSPHPFGQRAGNFDSPLNEGSSVYHTPITPTNYGNVTNSATPHTPIENPPYQSQRNVAWQPPSNKSNISPDLRPLSPEQWVERRAMIAAQPRSMEGRRPVQDNVRSEEWSRPDANMPPQASPGLGLRDNDPYSQYPSALREPGRISESNNRGPLLQGGRPAQMLNAAVGPPQSRPYDNMGPGIDGRRMDVNQQPNRGGPTQLSDAQSAAQQAFRTGNPNSPQYHPQYHPQSSQNGMPRQMLRGPGPLSPQQHQQAQFPRPPPQNTMNQGRSQSQSPGGYDSYGNPIVMKQQSQGRQSPYLGQGFTPRQRPQ